MASREYLNPFEHRNPLHTRQINEMVADLSSMQSVIAQLQAQAGPVTQEVPIFAQITGKDENGLYSWRLLYDGDDAALRVPYRASLEGSPDRYAAYERSSNIDVPIDGSAIVQLHPAEGGLYYWFDWNKDTIVAELGSSSGGAYSWEQVRPTEGGGWETFSGGQTGTTTRNPARERNGNTGTFTGRVVVLSRGYCSGAPRVTTAFDEHGDGATTNTSYTASVLNAASGTFRLIFDESSIGTNPQTTSGLPFTAAAATVEAALEVLSNIGTGNVSVTGTSGEYTIQFEGDYENHLLIEAVTTELESDQEWVFDAIESSGTTEEIVRLNGEGAGNTWTGNIQVSTGLGVTTGDLVLVYTGAHTSPASYFFANQTLLAKKTPFTSGGNTIYMPQYTEPFANLTIPGTISIASQSIAGEKTFDNNIRVGGSGGFPIVGSGGGTIYFGSTTTRMLYDGSVLSLESNSNATAPNYQILEYVTDPGGVTHVGQYSLANEIIPGVTVAGGLIVGGSVASALSALSALIADHESRIAALEPP